MPVTITRYAYIEKKVGWLGHNLPTPTLDNSTMVHLKM